MGGINLNVRKDITVCKKRPNVMIPNFLVAVSTCLFLFFFIFIKPVYNFSGVTANSRLKVSFRQKKIRFPERGSMVSHSYFNAIEALNNIKIIFS